MNARLNIVAVIPARYAATRLPGKPLVDLCGKPMIQHVVERTARATLVTRTVVATDDERIMKAVASFGGTAVMTPPELASGSDRVAHVARSLTDADIIVNVQGDEPLIAPEMIDEGIRPLAEDASISVGTVIRRTDSPADLSNAAIVKVVLDAQGFAIYFSRSPIPYCRDGAGISDWPRHHPYYKHIGLYVFRRAMLLQFAAWPESPLERAEKLEQLRLLEHGVRIKASVTAFDSTPVDTADDVRRVLAVMQQKGVHV